MSTRGLIAIQGADGRVRSIYCHHDMHLDGGGATLIEHYDTIEKVEALLALGALSALDVRLTSDPGEIHSYDTPLPDVCIAYHWDRGEQYRPPKAWHDANFMLSRAADDYWEEYVYLFRDGEWVFDTTYEPHGWRQVKAMLKEHINE